MTEPAVETWRVADLAPTAPAHLVVFVREQVQAMACGWLPRQSGVLLNRTEMLAACRFACIRCGRAAAKGRRVWGAALVDEVGT